jgi:argininosuccinate lyase/amino-acid N-acetyltransferase
MRLMQLCDDAIEHVQELERALVLQARAAGDQPVAAYTHLQPAQPILLAHWWLAHVAAFERDEERFQAARAAADRMPLGAGAIAGSPLRYDREALATRLGFSRVADNSLDAVGDRDFALEYLNAASVLAIHLSRLAEDLVLWCSPAFAWFRAPDGFATGSSLLPNKRNPDVFELTRGKSARLIANAERLTVLLKGLPSGYQKDLQEDKESVFDTADTIDRLLSALAPAIAALEADVSKLQSSLSGDLLAIELADALVADGVPFRTAHQSVGALWAAAERAGVEPKDLPLAQRTAIDPRFTDERLSALNVTAALERRGHAPGGGPASVAQQLAAAEERLGGSAGRHDVQTVGDGEAKTTDVVVRRARLEDVPGIAGVMAEYVTRGVLLPRPISELYQCVREFHVAVRGDEIVGCAALRVLWSDLGEVRSLAIRPDHHGLGLGASLVQAVIDDARAVQLPRVIALTREVGFFERAGFRIVSRDTLPRKVWTDCVRCPRRHACDEVAVTFDIVPGASEAAAQRHSWALPIPQVRHIESAGQPVVS